MEEFGTSDIYFAGFLSAKGNNLKRTDKVVDEARGNKTKIVFVFNMDAVKYAELKNAYFGGSGEVNAMGYMNALRNLKSLCFM